MWANEWMYSIMKNMKDKGVLFNGILVNYYDSDGCIGAHSDKTAQLIKDSPILSISLGETREFRIIAKKGISFRKKTLLLSNGDVIAMCGELQKTHKHDVRRLEKYTRRRINITLRCFK